MCINALAFSVKHNIFKILLLDKKLRVQCFLESIFSFLAWCREGAQRYRTSFKNKETKKISRVLSSVQGSFPVLLIKLWDIKTQTGVCVDGDCYSIQLLPSLQICLLRFTRPPLIEVTANRLKTNELGLADETKLIQCLEVWGPFAYWGYNGPWLIFMCGYFPGPHGDDARRAWCPMAVWQPQGWELPAASCLPFGKAVDVS